MLLKVLEAPMDPYFLKAAEIFPNACEEVFIYL